MSMRDYMMRFLRRHFGGCFIDDIPALVYRGGAD